MVRRALPTGKLVNGSKRPETHYQTLIQLGCEPGAP